MNNRIACNTQYRQNERVQTGSSRILLALFVVSFPAIAFAEAPLWLTNPDKSALFQRQSAPLTFAAGTNAHPTIAVDNTKSYQTIDGFGFTLTGGRAPDRADVIPVLKEILAINPTLELMGSHWSAPT